MAAGNQEIRQRLSKWKGWVVGQIGSHTDLAGHRQARVKKRKVWEGGGWDGGPPPGSLVTYWYRVHSGGLCGPESTLCGTGRWMSQWCWNGCWLGMAGRTLPQTEA